MPPVILKNNPSASHSDSRRPLPVSIQFSRFRAADGMEEIQWIIRPTEYAHFKVQLAWIKQAYEQAVQSMGLEMDSAVFRRFLCSDLINQEPVLRGDSFTDPDLEGQDCAISWVRQVPAPPSKVTLWATHLRDPEKKLEKSYRDRNLSLKRGKLTHHWSTGVTAADQPDSHAQTHGIFDQYNQFLHTNHMTLADHVVRTWFFVQNVDNNYAGMVEARNEVFDKEGLTADTHYIASTGIEGGYTDAPTNTLLDAYAIQGLESGQIDYLHALQHLSPTHVYGVAFERATSIAYRDRKHIFISGTASIDDKGVTLHRGDIHRQLERTLENIEALLAEADASLDDMQVFLVYLRDPADEAVVRQEISRRFPDLPFEIVTAPVCRPGWLIEIEGLAAIANDAPELPKF